jgi:hypothetical protein
MADPNDRTANALGDSNPRSCLLLPLLPLLPLSLLFSHSRSHSSPRAGGASSATTVTAAAGAGAPERARAEDVGVVGIVGTDDAVVALGGAAGRGRRARAGGDGVGGVVTAAEEFCVVVVVVVGVLCAGVCEAPGAVRVDALALRELVEDLVAGGRALEVEKQWTAAWRAGEHAAHPAKCKRGTSQGPSRS